jgi:uncharacterized membrane protein
MVHKRREVSRVEGFSDAVFAFAITLLVVSLEVPKSFDELMHVVRAFPAFAVSFALLFQIWWRHYRFFRSYDLEDGIVIALTGVLLFVVLFYVYPLKFVWSLAFSQLQGQGGTSVVIQGAQGPRLMEIYSAGVIAVFTLLALLYAHAYRLRDALGLTPTEVVDAYVEILRNAAIAGFGLTSFALCLIGGPAWIAAAGLVYFGIGLSEWALGEYRGRRRRAVTARTTDTSIA